VGNVSSSRARARTNSGAQSQRVDIHEWISKAGSESSGSAPEEVRLRQVVPTKYWQFRLLPMNPKLYAEYVFTEAATETDMSRFAACVHNKIDYARLSSDTDTNREKQRAYYLSFLKVHNTLILQSAQAQVKGSDDRAVSFFGRREATLAEKLTTKVKQAAKLLDIAQAVGYLTGVDDRLKHSTYGSPVDLPSMRTVADVALKMGSQKVADLVGQLHAYSAPLLSTTAEGVSYVAQGWSMNELLFTVFHAWTGLGKESQRAWSIDCEDLVTREQDDIVVCKSGGKEYPYRAPVNGEHAYVIFVDVAHGRVKPYGFLVVTVSEGICMLNGVMIHGYSGSLVVAANDGCVIGMYVGKYMEINKVDYSWFVSSSDIF